MKRGLAHALGLAAVPLALCLIAASAAQAAGAPAAPAGSARSGRAAGAPGAGPGGTAAALEAVYAAARHLPPASVGGIRAGSLHTGSAGGANWAIASFVPAVSDPANVKAAFQDGASGAVFRQDPGQAPGKAWHLAQAGPYGCGRGLPASLQQSFGLADPAPCRAQAPAERAAAQRAPRGTATTGQRIAGIALSQVGVGATPAMTNFGTVDCDPYSTLVGAQSPNADGCGLDPHFKIENQNEEWCSDFAKWVWQQAGVTVDMNTINAGAVSYYDWGLDQGETMVPDSGTPAVGDAVVFFPPGPVTRSTYADHVGIVTGVNPDGTVNMANGDFAGAPDISVQYNTGINLTPWASQMWNAGEQWVLVTPPDGAQQQAPAAAISGPRQAVTGIAISFRALAAQPGGSVSHYLWTFGDGRADNTSGPAVSHVYAENGTYPVTVSVTSSTGTVTTRAWDVSVTGASSPVASVPVNAVWYSPTPVDEYLFLKSPSGGLAADTWDGASWLQLAMPGRPASGSGLTALSYPDPAAGDAMTPHAYYSSAGGLAETYLGSSGWTARSLPGQPAGGSAIAAESGVSGPEVFYFTAGRHLAESAAQQGSWATSAVGGPAAASIASLALAATDSGPELFYLSGSGSLTAASEHGGQWQANQIASGAGVAPGSPLAAVTNGPDQVSVYFVDGRGKLAEAVTDAPGWAVSEVPGGPAPVASLTATSYLRGAQSSTGEPVGVGTEVFTLNSSGQPSVTYSSGATASWQTAALPGTGTSILAAEAYQNAGEPSRVYLSGPLSADEASTPGGPWTSAALPATPASLADSVVLYAATASDYTAALDAAAAAGLPDSQVTRSFATAWADALSGNYLVISVGQAATDALYYNVCGWPNPSGEIPGGTPFSIVGGPLNSLPGPDLYEEAAAKATSQTPALAADLAYYATHGQLPPGVTAPPPEADPVYACAGEAS